MDTYKKILLFLVFLFINNVLLAQKNLGTKTLYLKDGSFLLGTLVEGNATEFVWQLTDGTQITLPVNQAVGIKEPKHNVKYLKNGNIKKTTGYFTSIIVGALFEKRASEFSDGDNAASFNITFGGYLNDKFSLAFGTGYDRYETPIIPTYLDFRGDLFSSSVVTPYYKLSAGYGFISATIDQKNNPNLRQTGGILVHPSIGMKVYTKSSVAWMFDFGYRIQRFQQKIAWEENPKRWTLRRTTVRIGLEF